MLYIFIFIYRIELSVLLVDENMFEGDVVASSEEPEINALDYQKVGHYNKVM